VPADLLASLLPLVCPGCGAAAEPICPRCASGLHAAPPAGAPGGVDAWFAAFAYEGVARELVARVKYRGAHAVVGWLAAAMAPLVPPPLPDVVTWAPTTPARRRERGFDHAELLARAVGRLACRRSRRLLSRAPGRPQTGQPVAARRVGPAFAPRGRVPAAVLLVDDVATTGATIAAAAVALRDGGAERIVALTAARTPP
jgi:predicted amidophosphoribosyltransferase